MSRIKLAALKENCTHFGAKEFVRRENCIISSPADSSLLISDFEPQQAGAEVGTEDEFDPIPVTGRKNSQGESLNRPWGPEGSDQSQGLVPAPI